MKIPFLDAINQLGTIGYILFIAIGIVMVYLTFANRIDIMFALIVLSAAFVGSNIPMIDGLASVSRWVTMFLLLLAGVVKSRMKVSLGGLLFWMYVLMGFAFLFNAVLFSWQFQRSMLLIIVTLGISFTYGDKSIGTYKNALLIIALCATVFSLVNIAFLPAQLNNPARFSGFVKGAPAFAMSLGSLLPFAFYGFLQSKKLLTKIICGVGFLAGAIVLFFTAQRAGTIAGVLGLLPLAFFVRQSKNFGWYLVLAIVVIFAGQYFLQNASTARLDYILSRYNVNAGLSSREGIWAAALNEIGKHPFTGKGFGAAELLVTNSFHNTYLEIWYNTGILGLLFFIGAQGYYLLQIIRTIWTEKDPDKVAMLALALGYFMGFLVLCMVESVGSGASNATLAIYIFFGIMVSNIEIFRQKPAQPVGDPIKS
jgi:O-antigen ligase